MNNIPKSIFIDETNFANAWARAVRHVLREGVRLRIGDAEKPKHILDTCAMVELTGAAVRQVEDREIHPKYPWRLIDQYCVEFQRDYLEEYIELPEDKQFSYLYFERLARYGAGVAPRDQMNGLEQLLSFQIKDGISSNRDQAITWQPHTDFGSDAPPCLQRIWIRYLGDWNVEVHLTWRSRDLYTAWQANMIAIIDMLNREVIRPNDCKIVKVLDYSDSLHIYDGDVFAARGVELIPAFRM